MNDNELKNIWQTTNERLEKSLTLITNNTDDISRMKAGNFLHSIRSVKFLALLAGVAWVGIGVTFLSRIYMNGYSGCNKFFLFSATFQILLTAISLFLYLYQLIKIHQTDVFGPILQTQEKLAQIKISTLWVVRILFFAATPLDNLLVEQHYASGMECITMGNSSDSNRFINLHCNLVILQCKIRKQR